MKNFLIIAGTVLALFSNAHARADDSAANSSGLQQAAAIDIVGKSGNAADGQTGRLLPREAEVLFFAPADHVFDGLLNFAAHQEDGVATFEIHESYIGSTRLIPRSRFRIGQYFLGIGRLNQFHRHDWPFVSAPKMQRGFFHEEGLLDSGIEVSSLLPLPFFLDVTAGVTNGWTFGHSHNEGSAPLLPTHYLRAATYLSLPWEGGTQLGWNYLGRKDDKGGKSTFWGFDFTAKWRESQTLKFLLQAETWLRIQTPANNPSEYTLAGYLFPQYGLDANWTFGIRGDYWSILSLKDAVDRSISNLEYAIVPTLSYKVSEFTTLRAAYTFESARRGGSTLNSANAFQIQSMFILGAHPAHDF